MALNVYGNPLERCSQPGMALTGFTRSGSCVDINGDSGSHHICIDLSSTTKAGDFCVKTGQPDWCHDTDMECDTSGPTDADMVHCPVEQWCICQWAFAKYIQEVGCDDIQTIVCESINMNAYKVYEELAGQTDEIADAFACLKSRCGLN